MNKDWCHTGYYMSIHRDVLSLTLSYIYFYWTPPKKTFENIVAKDDITHNDHCPTLPHNVQLLLVIKLSFFYKFAYKFLKSSAAEMLYVGKVTKHPYCNKLLWQMECKCFRLKVLHPIVLYSIIFSDVDTSWTFSLMCIFTLLNRCAIR